MIKFKATYFRNITEVYEVEIEAPNEESAENIIFNSYGKSLDGERLINRYSDDVEIDEIEEIN